MRRAAPLACLLLAILVFPAMKCFEDSYPTDQCVRIKLIAAAALCEELVQGGPGSGDLAAFRDAWANAEALSAAQGVDCAETTGTSAGMEQTVADAAAGIVSSIDTRVCSSQVAAAGNLCNELVTARGEHLVRRDRDRDRSGLARAIKRADRRFFGFSQGRGQGRSHSDSSSDSGHSSHGRGPRGGTCDSDGVLAATHDAAHSIVEQATISPNAPGDWTAVLFDEGEQVAYDGATWEPSCWDGAPYRLYVKKGTVNKLLMYYQGGGACWDFFTCENEIFKTGTGPGDNPAGFASGFFDPANPDNPFRDWHVVFVPYCTGDIHWGDNDVTYEAGGGIVSIDVKHHGFHNGRMAEKWAREHFVDPDAVFVTGSSAGAYGAIGHGAWLSERVYPSSDLSILGDAGNGVITPAFLANNIGDWNVDTVLPDWIPELNVPITELDASDLYSAVAKNNPNHRVATYTSAYDGSGGGQTGFYNVMLNPLLDLADVLEVVLGTWQRWWEASCAWNENMLALNAKAQADAANFRSYVGSGSRHTMWGSNKIYSDTTGGVPTIVDWVNAMLDDTPAWQNVQATNFGLLLPGDPRPNPLEPPFTTLGSDTVIDCSP